MAAGGDLDTVQSGAVEGDLGPGVSRDRERARNRLQKGGLHDAGDRLLRRADGGGEESRDQLPRLGLTEVGDRRRALAEADPLERQERLF
jgi:hypothetical protein